MSVLTPGTAEQIAARLRQLADYGDSKHPPDGSALDQLVLSARSYADHLLTDVAPQAAGVVIVETTDIFHTAEGIAEGIVDEGTSGAYGDASPPPSASGVSWPLVLGAAAGLGVLGYYAHSRGML